MHHERAFLFLVLVVNSKGLQFRVRLCVKQYCLDFAGMINEHILAVGGYKRMLNVLPCLDMFQRLMRYRINNSDRITAVFADINLLQVRRKAGKPACRPCLAMAYDHILLWVNERKSL